MQYKKNHIKIIIINSFLMLLFFQGLFAENNNTNPNPWKIDLQFTWDIGLRLGLEYELFPHFALRTDIGSTIFSLEGAFVITYDIFGVYKITDRDYPFQINLLIGAPYNMFVTGADAAMLSFGGSIEAGYQFNKNYSVYIRGGGGYPVFYSRGSYTYGSVNLPFWPDLALEMKYSY